MSEQEKHDKELLEKLTKEQNDLKAELLAAEAQKDRANEELEKRTKTEEEAPQRYR